MAQNTAEIQGISPRVSVTTGFMLFLFARWEHSVSWLMCRSTDQCLEKLTREPISYL